MDILSGHHNRYPHQSQTGGRKMYKNLLQIAPVYFHFGTHMLCSFASIKNKQTKKQGQFTNADCAVRRFLTMTKVAFTKKEKIFYLIRASISNMSKMNETTLGGFSIFKKIDCAGQMLGGGSHQVIHYTPAVISSSASGAVVLMEPSAVLGDHQVVVAESDDGTDRHGNPGSSQQQQQHSPLHLPSATFLNTHISKSVSFFFLFFFLFQWGRLLFRKPRKDFKGSF